MPQDRFLIRFARFYIRLRYERFYGRVIRPGIYHAFLDVDGIDPTTPRCNRSTGFGSDPVPSYHPVSRNFDAILIHKFLKGILTQPSTGQYRKATLYQLCESHPNSDP